MVMFYRLIKGMERVQGFGISPWVCMTQSEKCHANGRGRKEKKKQNMPRIHATMRFLPRMMQVIAKPRAVNVPPAAKMKVIKTSPNGRISVPGGRVNKESQTAQASMAAVTVTVYEAMAKQSGIASDCFNGTSQTCGDDVLR